MSVPFLSILCTLLPFFSTLSSVSRIPQSACSRKTHGWVHSLWPLCRQLHDPTVWCHNDTTAKLFLTSHDGGIALVFWIVKINSFLNSPVSCLITLNLWQNKRRTKTPSPQKGYENGAFWPSSSFILDFWGKGELRFHFVLSEILTCSGLLAGRGSWKMTWVNVFGTVFHLTRFPRLFLACERQTFLLAYRRWGTFPPREMSVSGDERGEASAVRRLRLFPTIREFIEEGQKRYSTQSIQSLRLAHFNPGLSEFG